MSIFDSYPGSKAGSGVWQRIISQMRPHERYVEAFLGGGTILRRKLPAAESIGLDLDAAVIAAWAQTGDLVPGLRVVQADAVAWLAEHGQGFGAETLIYCDPPYLMSVRSSQRQFYAVEMGEAAQHQALLEVLRGLRCGVILSGYWSDLYARALADWRVVSFPAMTRGGRQATEYLWINYAEPFALHDYRWLGENFREREQLKRQKARWVARLERMPALQRAALLAAIQTVQEG